MSAVSHAEFAGPWLDAVGRARAEAIEQACEMALQGGTRGVLVVESWERRPDGQMVYVVDASLDQGVPYGEVWHRPGVPLKPA